MITSPLSASSCSASENPLIKNPNLLHPSLSKMNASTASTVVLPPTPSSPADETHKCSNCNSDDHLLHHTVCIRTNRSTYFRRYCTSCVLRTHRYSFCPTCFSLHNDPNSSTPQSPPVRTLACLKCKSYSHFSCVPSNAPKSPYLCPPCSTPNYKFFDVRKPSSNKLAKQSGDKSRKGQYIDLRLSKVLLLAAKIAANSLNNAAKSAKQDADQNVKIAAVTRKRTREALEVLTQLWISEKDNSSVSVSAYAQTRENGVAGNQNALVQQTGEKNGPSQLMSGQNLNDGNGKAIYNHVGHRVGNGVQSNNLVGKQVNHGVPSNYQNLQNSHGKKVE